MVGPSAERYGPIFLERPMNKESIEDRIKELEAQQEQAKQSFLGCAGAIEDCKYWLSQLPVEKKKNV